MTDRESGNAQHQEASCTPPNDSEWNQEKAKVRVRQFMNILEQLPRLCSPTICGTLSQPTTRAERASRGAEMFEWSLEQKAILSPANITTDTEGTEDWHQNVSELNPAWRQQESEMFFSQRTIAPSPLIQTPSVRSRARPYMTSFRDLMFEEGDEDLENDNKQNNDDEISDDNDENDDRQAQDLRTNQHNKLDNNQSSRLISCEFQDDCRSPNGSDTNFDLGEEGDHDEDDYIEEQPTDQDMDNLFFSPEPLKSSQTQQRMDIFSPNTFVRVMEDENTLQSTPKTTGSSQRARTRTRTDVLD